MALAARARRHPGPRPAALGGAFRDERYRRFVETTHEGICILDHHSRIVFANRRLCEMLGYASRELIGREGLPLVNELSAEADFASSLSANVGSEHEVALRHRDGSTIWVSVRGTPMQDESGRSAGVLTMFSDITKRRLAEQQARDAAERIMHAELEEQAKSLEILRQRERIAMDLHDGVIQSLYGVALRLGALRRRARPPRATAPSDEDEVLGQVIAQLTDTIKGIRAYIYDLRAGLPEASDLSDGLRELAEEVAKTGPEPRLRLKADTSQLAREVVNHLLYIAHEALSNVARHAHARTVEISLVPGPRRGFTMRIADDGDGFDPERRGRRFGDGLHNIRHRARLIGAKLSIESQLGSGTIVSVRVP